MCCLLLKEKATKVDVRRKITETESLPITHKDMLLLIRSYLTPSLSNLAIDKTCKIYMTATLRQFVCLFMIAFIYL